MSKSHADCVGLESNLLGLFSNPDLGIERLELPAHRVVYDSGQPSKNVFLVESGQVRIYRQGHHSMARLIDIVGPGCWFGMASLSGRPVHLTRVLTAEASILLKAPVEQFLSALARCPTAASACIRQLSRQLVLAHEEAAQLMFDDCDTRLIRKLLFFAGSAAATPTDEGVVLHITHQELAQAVGVARETISVALTHLRRQNLLRTGRNQLFYNPETLQKSCDLAHEG